MAKGKSFRSGTRDASQSLTVSLRSRPKIARPSRLLSMVDDLRTFDFEPATRPARLFSGGVASVGFVPNSNKKAASGRPARLHNFQMAFTAPAETLVCVRRKRRKEVLFAKKKTGKGGQRKPRRSRWSDYRC